MMSGAGSFQIKGMGLTEGNGWGLVRWRTDSGKVRDGFGASVLRRSSRRARDSRRDAGATLRRYTAIHGFHAMLRKTSRFAG